MLKVSVKLEKYIYEDGYLIIAIQTFDIAEHYVSLLYRPGHSKSIYTAKYTLKQEVRY